MGGDTENIKMIKEKWKNFRVSFIYFLIRISIAEDDRNLFLKWIQMREELISEYDFNVWVTNNILED